MHAHLLGDGGRGVDTDAAEAAQHVVVAREVRLDGAVAHVRALRRLVRLCILAERVGALLARQLVCKRQPRVVQLEQRRLGHHLGELDRHISRPLVRFVLR